MSTRIKDKGLSHWTAFAFIFIILFVIALFFFGKAQAGQVVVTSLPTSISQSTHSADDVDTVTLQGTKLSSTGSGLKLVCSYHDPLSGYYVNLGTDTIEFAISGGASNYGLQIDQYGTGYYSDNIIVEGGTIICAPPDRTDSLSSKNNTCILISGQDILIKDVNTIADGFNGKCINGESDEGYMIDIDGGIHTSLVTHFKSRCQFDACMMKFWTGGWDSTIAVPNGYTYNAKIHNVTITNAPHAGIRVDGGTDEAWGIFKIYGCNIQIDSRDSLYTSYVGVCASSANAYGIAAQYLGPGSEIYNDTITSGTTYAGGRGILCEQFIGTASIPVLIHDNYINIHEGPNAEYAEAGADVHGLRIRYSCQYVNVYNNTIYAIGDNDTSTHSYSKSIMGLRYSFGGEGQDAGLTQSHLTIENNHFKAQSLNSGSDCMVVCFDDCIVQDTTLTFRYNYIEGDGIISRWAEYNEAGRYITMIGDTLNFLTPSYSPMTFYLGYSGMSSWSSNHNIIRDAVYLNGTAYDDINFANAGTCDLTIQRTLDILVVGSNSFPISDAIVWAKNNYGNEFFRDTTGSDGRAGKPVSILYDVRSGTDSTGYNPYTVWAKKGSDSDYISISVSPTLFSDTLTLPISGTNPATKLKIALKK